jgi:hypothetical protein
LAHWPVRRQVNSVKLTAGDGESSLLVGGGANGHLVGRRRFCDTGWHDNSYVASSRELKEREKIFRTS